jgi:hypothetical protein
MDEKRDLGGDKKLVNNLIFNRKFKKESNNE